MRVPWTARGSNQSIRKEVNPEYSLEDLMLKLYFGHLMLGKIEDRRKSGQQWMRWLDGITDSMGISLNKVLEMAKDREARYAVIHGLSKSRT